MKKMVIGILAHVDAGKTTLSESILYLSGKIGKLGRVDNKDAYLDNFELERARGITIFSKQAVFQFGDIQFTMLDTPGHVDFSAEMERTLWVLDCVILVVSGSSGVQGHTKTLWRLFETYKLPTFIFINKMDQAGTDKNKLLVELKNQLCDNCIEFAHDTSNDFYESVAMCSESLMDTYLNKGFIETEQMKKAIETRKIFPCFFGSALKLDGVSELLQNIVSYKNIPSYPDAFRAKIFKITRDEQGNRLTHLKITGGKLKVKDLLKNDTWEEKVNQIRIYSAKKFDAVNEVEAGTVCCVTGLSQAKSGEYIGTDESSYAPSLEPVLSYQIILPDGCDPRTFIPKLKQIEEEDPSLHIFWDEQLQEIKAQLMGEVQIEILQSIIENRFGIKINIGEGRIVYKETIANVVEGVGHFEPLRHYAEVHLLLEPTERGSGVKFETACSEDLLSRHWQRLVLTHLEEKTHKGVLIGMGITDIKITLVIGKAHNKHTEGGDFREATYRAVRQGLMEAESILLEPYYSFQLEVPEKMIGKAITDIEKMYGKCEISNSNGEIATLVGSAPVSTMRNYQKEVNVYTRGFGKLTCFLKGYEECHNAEEIIQSVGYNSDRDIENPIGSVFCKNGDSFSVNWDEVKSYMHLESYLKQKEETRNELDETTAVNKNSSSEEKWISTDEIDQIINSTYYSNKGKKLKWRPKISASESYYKPKTTVLKQPEVKEEYLMVDGYNIIFSWQELKELSEINMDSARTKLAEILSNYQGIRKCKIFLVFDAYRVQRHFEDVTNYYDIKIVYTREAQTADEYIEKFAHDNQKKYSIVVATSDGLQQIIIRGSGCTLLSARELKEEIERVTTQAIREHQNNQPVLRNYLKDSLSQESKQMVDELLKNQ